MIQARLADGRVLTFPDGTDPAVVQATVKRMTAAARPPDAPSLVSPLAELAADSFMADTAPRLEAKRGQMEDIAAFGDINRPPGMVPSHVPLAAPRMDEQPPPGRGRLLPLPVPGLREPGNVDLTRRPFHRNEDGSVSTVRSMSIDTDRGEVLIPTVNEFGRVMPDEEAIKEYERWGQHLGIYDSPENATFAAQAIHRDQEARVNGRRAELEDIRRSGDFGHEGFADVAEPGMFPDASKQGISQRSLRETVLDRGFGWAIGGAERAGLLPEGTRAAVRENQQEAFDRYLMAHPDGGLGRAAYLALGDAAASAAGPQALLGPGVGSLASRGAAALGAGQGGRVLAGLAGGALEGAGQGALDTIDLPPEERARMALVGAGMGALGAVHGLAAEKPLANAPQRPNPEIRGRVAAVHQAEIANLRIARASEARAMREASLPMVDSALRQTSGPPTLTPKVPRWANSAEEGVASFQRFADSRRGQAIAPDDLPFELQDLPLTRWTDAPDRGGPRRRSGAAFYLLGDSPEYFGVGRAVGGRHVLQESFTPQNPLVVVRPAKLAGKQLSWDNDLARQAEREGHDAILIVNNQAHRIEVVKTAHAAPGLERRTGLDEFVATTRYPGEQQRRDWQAFDRDGWKSLLRSTATLEPAAGAAQAIPEAVAARHVAVRFQGEYARLAAAGDEVAGVAADELQGALAPEVTAPPTLDLGRSRPTGLTNVFHQTPSEDLRAQFPDAIIDSRDAYAGPVFTGSERRQRPRPELDLEAGFITLPGRRKPARPAEPFDTLLAPRQTSDQPLGERLRGLADRITDEMLNAEDAPARLLRRSGQGVAADRMELLLGRGRGAGAWARDVITEGTYVFDPDLDGPGRGGSRRTGNGLQADLAGLDARAAEDLDRLAAAEHHMELVGRVALGEPLDIHPEGTRLAQEKIAELGARYGFRTDGRVAVLADLADKVRDWSVRAVMIPLKEAGRLSDREFTWQMLPNGSLTYGGDILAKNEFYAPFFRLMEVLGEDPEMLAGTTKGNPLHGISGGLSPERPIGKAGSPLPVLEGFVEQAQRVHMWTERQRARNFLADAVDASPELQVEVRKLPPQQQGQYPIHVRGTFSAWRDGQRALYAGPEDLIRAFEHLTPKQVPLVLQAAQAAVRTLRVGVTATLEFAARNPARDVQNAMEYGRGYRPWDFFAGLLDLTGNKRWAQEWKSNGGALSDMVSYQQPQLQATLADALARPDQRLARTIAARWKSENMFGKLVFPLLAPMEAASGLLERSTKVGAYRRLRLLREAPLDAAVASRDIGSPDFARGGYAAKAASNNAIAFFNPEMQGLYRFGRAMRRRPLAMTAKLAAYVTLPAVAHWYYWKDDPEHQSLKPFEKNGFYQLAKREDGTFWEIPRAPGIENLFGASVERFLDQWHSEDPKGTEKFAESVIEQTPAHFLPMPGRPSWDAVPTVLKPAMEASAGEGGWNSYQQRPIVPDPLTEGVLPEDRAMDRTTNLARGIGEKLNVAPLKVDHIIRGYLGRLGQHAAAATGNEAPDVGSSAQDIPLVKGFVSTPSIGVASQPVQELYELARESANAKGSLDKAVDEGDVRRYHAVLREHPELGLHDVLQDAVKELSEMRKARNEVAHAPGLSPDQRRDLLLQYDQRMMQWSYVNVQMAARVLADRR